MRVYSCYFSPNDAFEVFETPILLLEGSFSEAVGQCLIGVTSIVSRPIGHHRCIEFSLEQRCQAVDKGSGGKGRSPSWNTRRFCRERLRIHLETTRLIEELGWVGPAGSLEDTVRLARRK